MKMIAKIGGLITLLFCSILGVAQNSGTFSKIYMPKLQDTITVTNKQNGMFVKHTDGNLYFKKGSWLSMSGGGGGVSTASNGLNLVGSDVQLGGTITGNITFTGGFNMVFANAATRFVSTNLQLRNPGNTFSYINASSAIVADRTVTYPLLIANDIYVFQDHIQTLNNKTFLSGGLQLSNPANTFQYVHTGGAIVADRNVSYPVLTGNDEFTFNNAVQSFTNKTFDQLALTNGGNSTLAGDGFTGNAGFSVNVSTGINFATVAGNISFAPPSGGNTIFQGGGTNSIKGTHYSGKGVNTASVSVGAGAGTGPSISTINPTDLTGTITLTTGTLPTGAGSVLVQVTLSRSFDAADFNVLLQCENDAACSLSGIGTVKPVVTAANNFTINTITTALAASTVYVWSYFVVQ